MSVAKLAVFCVTYHLCGVVRLCVGFGPDSMSSCLLFHNFHPPSLSKHNAVKNWLSDIFYQCVDTCSYYLCEM